MPRTLVLVRHAKAAWPDGVVDHERPLAGRGRRDAPAIGRWLAGQAVSADLALVSSAHRTVQTYELLAAHLPGAPDPVVTDDVYAAGAGDLLDLLRGIDDEFAVVLVVGHNPGIGTLAGLLDDGAGAVDGRSRMRLEYPTSAVAIMDVDGGWSGLDPAGARLRAFGVPRG